MTTITSDDSLKMIRETFCVAATHVGLSDDYRKREHVDRLQRLIDDIDRQRPLGPDGKHGDLHTADCGCEDAATDADLTTPAGVTPATVDADEAGDGGGAR